MFIRSERLFLRPIWPEDWNELTTRLGEQAIMRLPANAPSFSDGPAGRAFLPSEPGLRCPQFLVTLPTSEGSSLIGCAGLAPRRNGIELGFCIAPERQGQGYATESVRAVLNLARTLGHRRIVASHFVDDHRSRNVLHKIGFRPAGEVRPRYCAARGTKVSAQTCVLTLDRPGDCDGNMRSIGRAA